MSDIILVTGRSLTRDWAMFSYNLPSNTRVSVQFQAGPGVWGSWSSYQAVNLFRATGLAFGLDSFHFDARYA
jgi:hypothetical protein